MGVGGGWEGGTCTPKLGQPRESLPGCMFGTKSDIGNSLIIGNHSVMGTVCCCLGMVV